MDIIIPSQAIHDPNAVMVMFRDTDVADTAMLASSRFEKVTGPANLARLIEYMVVWVVSHVLPVIFGSNY